jgi:transposase
VATMGETLVRWYVDVAAVRERIYRAGNPRERERWHALWLLARGWSATQVAEALGRDLHTVGAWLHAFEQGGPPAVTFEQAGSAPLALTADQQAALDVALESTPRAVGIELANWTWKAVRAYLREHFGVCLGKSSCLRYLHRLGFVWKRPKKRLTKADAAQRAAFVREYLALVAEAEQTGAKIFFVDEAHFRADGDLRGLWVRKGTLALVDSTSPRWGEKASYYSAVCLETGEVEAMHLETTSSAQTSVAFLRQLRATHPEPVIVIWDNSPAHSGDALRQYLATPELRLVHLPAYSPDYNADEAIWDWIRDEVTANACFGTQAEVREHVDAFFHGLKSRIDEVKTRCRTVLQAHALASAAM